LLKTVEFTVASFIGGVILGLVVAMLRLSRPRILRAIAATYTEIFKNIPLLAIIFLAYFGLVSLGIKLDVFQAGCLSLIVFYAAYLSEIFRAAISGVHAGQLEASNALGLSQVTAYTHVVFPQALRLALPGTNTMAVDLLKSTSLLVTISAAELMTQGSLIASETFQALEVYIVIALIYFAVCYPLSQVLLWIERRVRAGKPMTMRRARRLRAARRLLSETAVSA
ncbi:MAG: amino acid ABC transporter permease, partial [Trebonia sp.]